MGIKKCNGDCFNCQFGDCILDIGDVPLDEDIDEYVFGIEYKRNKDKAKASKEYHKNYWHKYYPEHKEEVRKRFREYYLNKREWINSKNKEYYAKNREKLLEYARNYNLKNKDKMIMRRKERYRKYTEEKKEILSKK